MLIILNAVETIHESALARRITETLNTFTCGGYTVDYSSPLAKFVDADGNVVFEENDSNPDTGPSPEVIQEFNALQEELLEISKRSHFNTIFEDVMYDYGLIPTTEILTYTAEEPCHAYSYATMLADYKARKYEYYVISGVFSYEIVKKFRKSLGKDNVVVLNVVRNPSLCFLLNKKDENYYSPLDTATSRPILGKFKLEKSLLNACTMYKRAEAITVRYEDMIRDGGFDLLGKFVRLPVGSESYNGNITQWEYDNYIPLQLESPEYIDLFNEEYSNYDFHLVVHFDNPPEYDADGNVIFEYRRLKDGLDFYNEIHGTTITLGDLDRIPKNIFTELGYEPLNYAAIVKPNDSQPQAV